MSETKQITVVIPVYNVESYLRRCIDSIVCQTIKNIDIILVDDGSTDNSGKICDEYREIDNRIKVVHQKNQGLSAARNVGIKMAKTKYICFIDSDDYVEKDMLEYLYEGTLQSGADIVCCGFTNIYENGEIEKITIPDNDVLFSKEEALDIHLFSGYIEVVAWNKLYKLELFNNITYPEGKLYEDMLTTYKLIDKSNCVLLRPDSKYYYCKRNNSIGGVAFSRKTLSLIDACDTDIEYISNKYNNLKNIKVSKIQWYIIVCNKAILSDKKIEILIKKIKKMIIQNFRVIVFNKYLNRTRKFQILLFLVSYKLYKKLYKKFVLKHR